MREKVGDHFPVITPLFKVSHLLLLIFSNNQVLPQKSSYYFAKDTLDSTLLLSKYHQGYFAKWFLWR
jgi:hypothetical protein